MELRHEFTVPVPVDDAWRTLLDIERVAPCLPGATVEEFDDKTVTGSVRVKVGPVTVTYKGSAVFEERDEQAHRVVLVAGGRDARGQGTARATVTGTLSERDGVTAVTVHTDLTVTGRPAASARCTSPCWLRPTIACCATCRTCRSWTTAMQAPR